MERRGIDMLTLLVCGLIAISSWCVSCVRLPSFHSHRSADRRNLLANGLAITPPMGWNSWNHFNCKIDEKIIKETADALVSTGLAKLGYEYVNVDDCWAEIHRDDKGNLLPKKSTFPSGIKKLADYVHSKGLKLGIYSDAGYFTCSKTMPGSLGHEEQDAKTFASWVWAGPLRGSKVAVLLLNRGPRRYSITAQWADIGIPPDTVVEARDVWEHNTLKRRFVGNLTATMNSHACKMYILKPLF